MQGTCHHGKINFIHRTLYIEEVSVDHPQRSRRRSGARLGVFACLNVIYLREDRLERRLDVERAKCRRLHVRHAIFRWTKKKWQRDRQ